MIRQTCQCGYVRERPDDPRYYQSVREWKCPSCGQWNSGFIYVKPTKPHNKFPDGTIHVTNLDNLRNYMRKRAEEQDDKWTFTPFPGFGDLQKSSEIDFLKKLLADSVNNIEDEEWDWDNDYAPVTPDDLFHSYLLSKIGDDGPLSDATLEDFGI